MAPGKEKLFVIPAPGFGHLSSILEMVKKLLRRRPADNRFSITLLIINSPVANENDHAKKLSSSNPDINFVEIPLSNSAPKVSWGGPSGNSHLSYINSHKQNVLEVVKKLVSKTDKICFIVDMFCGSMVEVANQLDVGCYSYFVAGAAFAGLCHFIAARSEVGGPGPDWLVPSYVNPVPTSLLPRFAIMKDDYADYSNNFKMLTKMKGVIVNTFAELEPHALKSLILDDGSKGPLFPLVYPVGPVLVDLSSEGATHHVSEAERTRMILNWLDEQDNESVVFLCFGREGCFKTEQVNEIALGLEFSGVKFLWAIKKQVTSGRIVAETDDLNDILPEGFLTRIGGQGIVCGWAPQLEILSHPAVGGFVTHCGMQSVLESLWFGVPTASWPLYAEQQMNAFLMVYDLKLSFEIKIDYKMNQEELVPAHVIQNAIKYLISDDESSKQMRQRVKEMSKIIRTVHVEGGSSFEAIHRLIFDISSNCKTTTLLGINNLIR